MKISTRGRYALRLMIDLAKNQEEGNMSLKDISCRQEISVKYLEHIVSLLVKKELVKSTRGAKGGYSLTRLPNQYTPKEILEAVEGPIACVSCLEKANNTCSRYRECPTVVLYEGLNKVINEYLESFTLEELIKMKII
ncbi:MAG: RrF2 family transcriptional regulator [Coprobacillaceae bacterium]